MAHPGGRPTKYDPSFCDELDKYLSTTGKEQTSLPTKQGFALWLGVDDETLLEWSKIYPEFSAAFKKLKQIQAKQLIDDGIYGGKNINATIVKLLLQNNHGMKERTDISTNDKDMNQPHTVLVKFIDGKQDNRDSDRVQEAV